MSGIAILGSGMAGLGAAWRLRQEGHAGVIYEKQPYPGGHTATYPSADGFLFDDGPHVSFTKNERIQELFAESVGGEYEILQAQVNNHWKGHWIKHPAQVNLHGLPEELVVAVIEDFVAAGRTEPGEISNYEEWLLESFGRTFAETFPMEYTLKYHTAPAREMSTDWLGPRLYRPELAEVLRGALSPSTADVHYVSHFRYPTRGGFESYLRMFLDGADVRLDHEVVGIDPAARRLRFAGGTEASYRRLISSLPLPALVSLLDGAPAEVAAAASRLAWTECVTVNVGVDRDDVSECHWTYFYDRDFTLTRLSFPHMYSPHNTPPGAGSIQAEVYFSAKYRPRDREPDELVEPVLDDLRRAGLVRPDDTILHTSARLVPWANVIFDHDRAPALEVIRGYLDEIGIEPCGRYGEWGYHWTDESFESGERAAERALERPG